MKTEWGTARQPLFWLFGCVAIFGLFLMTHHPAIEMVKYHQKEFNIGFVIFLIGMALMRKLK